MPVVNVGPVHVRMRERLVYVKVVVFSYAFPVGVPLRVMLVVLM